MITCNYVNACGVSSLGIFIFDTQMMYAWLNQSPTNVIDMWSGKGTTKYSQTGSRAGIAVIFKRNNIVVIFKFE
jgi:hypothetical protein